MGWCGWSERWDGVGGGERWDGVGGGERWDGAAGGGERWDGAAGGVRDGMVWVEVRDGMVLQVE